MSARRISAVAKDFRPLVRQALLEGWTLTQTRHGHAKLTAPDGSYATPVPGSSNNPSLLRAFAMRLRKHGLGEADDREASGSNGSRSPGSTAARLPTSPAPSDGAVHVANEDPAQRGLGANPPTAKS